jgi:hypothetical protein
MLADSHKRFKEITKEIDKLWAKTEKQDGFLHLQATFIECGVFELLQAKALVEKESGCDNGCRLFYRKCKECSIPENRRRDGDKQTSK